MSVDPGPSSVGWHDIGGSAELPPRGIVPAEVDGIELVVWRAAHGTVCAAARRCPHLDADLAVEGVVDGGDLVCGMHFWRVDRRGRVVKVNVRGRRDHKVDVLSAACREVDGRLQVQLPPGVG